MANSVAVELARLWAPENLRRSAPGIALCCVIAAVAFVANANGWMKFGRVMIPPLIVTLVVGMCLQPLSAKDVLKPGLDFAGPFMTPIYATAPGVVSFTGVRTGYGNVVEIDHGGGFKTRYAHLASYSVKPGDRVAVGTRIAAMGSTGRSTGVHLHYEVWMNGRPQNPARFVKAGDYVQQD